MLEYRIALKIEVKPDHAQLWSDILGDEDARTRAVVSFLDGSFLGAHTGRGFCYGTVYREPVILSVLEVDTEEVNDADPPRLLQGVSPLSSPDLF